MASERLLLLRGISIADKQERESEKGGASLPISIPSSTSAGRLGESNASKSTALILLVRLPR